MALEGGDQDELFDILSGQTRPGAGEVLVDGSPVQLRHPADAIGRIVLVPADRVSALLMQRSVRENIGLPRIAPARRWGVVDAGAERRRVASAIDRLQIDTRAQSEARRLSGGNQQKVTIARWLESGVRTFLFYDPTRGIDIGTKREIYRSSASSRSRRRGAAPDVRARGDPAGLRSAIVIYGGQVVDELPAARATSRPFVRRTACRSRPETRHDRLDGGDSRRRAGRGTDELARSSRTRDGRRRMDDRSGSGVVLLYIFTLLLRPAYGLEALAIASLPVAFAAAGQAIVVISGGIDLSIGSVIALTNVISAVLLLNAPELSLPIVVLVLLIGILIGLVNGTLVVISRVPDIVVTLSMLFVWAGAAAARSPTHRAATLSRG